MSRSTKDDHPLYRKAPTPGFHWYVAGGKAWPRYYKKQAHAERYAAAWNDAEVIFMPPAPLDRDEEPR